MGCKGEKVLQDAGFAADKLAASAGQDNPVPGSLTSPNPRRQSEMLADRATGQVPQPENLMRSGNTVENAGKPNQTAIGLIEAVSAQSSTQYEIETRTAQRKSIVRDAILKFSENTDLRNKPLNVKTRGLPL